MPPEEQAFLDLFTNRNRIVREFCAYLNEDLPQNKIIFLHGMGGSGKTYLVRFLKKYACRRFTEDDWQYLRSLEPDQFTEAIALADHGADVPRIELDFSNAGEGNDRPREPFYALLMLRRQLANMRIKMPVFDCAITLYLHKTGRLTQEHLRSLLPSNALDFADALFAAVTNNPWGAVAAAAYGLVSNHLDESFTLYRQQRGVSEKLLEELKRIPARPDLLDKLPELFALDLNAALSAENAPKRLVLFFDTHEALWGQQRNKVYSHHNNDAWLRKLLHTVDRSKGIVTVVAGRDFPLWGEAQENKNPIDAKEIAGLHIRHFAKEDAMKYLESAKVQNVSLREHLVQFTGGHPYFLSLCADLVRQAQDNGEELTEADFQRATQESIPHRSLVERLLRYVDDAVSDAVHVMSAARSFDEHLYRTIAWELRLPAYPAAFERLVGFSFIERIDDNLYRPHALLRQLLFDHKLMQQGASTLEAYYRDQAGHVAIAEALYHFNQHDPAGGVQEWCDTLIGALDDKNYDLCVALESVRLELQLPNALLTGWVLTLAARFAMDYANFELAEDMFAKGIKQLGSAESEESIRFLYRGIAHHLNGRLLQMQTHHSEAEQQYQLAVNDLRQSADINPNQPKTWNNLGIALHGCAAVASQSQNWETARTHYADAIEAYKKALSLDDQYIQAFNNLGNAQERLGELFLDKSDVENANNWFDEALASYQSAIDLRPNWTAPHNGRGVAFHILGEMHEEHSLIDAQLFYEEAITEYGLAVHLEPQNYYAKDNLGTVHLQLGQVMAQLKQIQVAIEHIELAISYGKEASDLAPNDQYVVDNLAKAQHALANVSSNL